MGWLVSYEVVCCEFSFCIDEQFILYLDSLSRESFFIEGSEESGSSSSVRFRMIFEGDLA